MILMWDVVGGSSTAIKLFDNNNNNNFEELAGHDIIICKEGEANNYKKSYEITIQNQLRS